MEYLQRLLDKIDRFELLIGRTAHPNHAGIYLGTDPSLPGEESGVVGPGPFLLHHLYGRPSEIIVFGGPWNDRTRLILRHKVAATVVCLHSIDSAG